jgi:hypothetical protein
MIVPLSSLTLLFSELTTDPWAFSAFAASFTSDIPMTPWVLAVMGGRALPPDCPIPGFGMLLGVCGWVIGEVPPLIGLRPPPLPIDGLGLLPYDGLPLPASAESLFCGAMIAWIDMGNCISPILVAAWSKAMATSESF